MKNNLLKKAVLPNKPCIKITSTELSNSLPLTNLSG